MESRSNANTDTIYYTNRYADPKRNAYTDAQHYPDTVCDTYAYDHPDPYRNAYCNAYALYYANSNPDNDPVWWEGLGKVDGYHYCHWFIEIRTGDL